MSANYKVAYIASMTHSGSTLLDSLLGAHSQAFSVGEIFELGSYTRMERKESHKTLLGNQCTCGAANVWECEFWTQVDQNIREISDLSLKDLTINSHDPAIFAHHNKLLFDSVAKVSGASWIIDSSKFTSRFLKLAQANFVEVRPIHLIRDPRGQVYSMIKREFSSELYPSLRYCASTIKRLVKLHRYDPLVVRYEQLAADPVAHLKTICAHLELNFEESQLNWHETVRHNLGGNAMRVLGKPEIRLDNEWQKKLAKRQVMAINVITAPARYMSVRY